MQRLKLDTAAIARLHWEDGQSILEISRRLGCSRTAICGALRRDGYSYRSGSEAMFVRHSKMTTDERMRLAEGAHRARRGVKAKRIEILRRSRTHERRQNLSEIETVFAEALSAAGVSFVPLLAVSSYNIDLALQESKIAIEIDPGHWHQTRNKRAADAVKDVALHERGWRIIRVSGKALRMGSDRLASMAEQTVAYLQAAGLDPAPAGEYRVIWGERYLKVAGMHRDEAFTEIVDMMPEHPPTLTREAAQYLVTWPELLNRARSRRRIYEDALR